MEQEREMNEEVTIDLVEVFHVLWSKAWLILLVGVVFALGGILAGKLFSVPQYESVTKMYVLTRDQGSKVTSGDLQLSFTLTKEYEEMVKSRTVTEGVISELGLNLTYEQLLSKVQVICGEETSIVTIKVRDTDPYRARDIANTIRDKASEHIIKVMNIEGVNVVDEANVPQYPLGSGTMKKGILAGILGCILVAGVLVVQFAMNDTIKDEEDVERYLDIGILGLIPETEEDLKNSRKLEKRRRRQS